SQQDPIPPFRDAYQTSTFLAARLIANLSRPTMAGKQTEAAEQWNKVLGQWKQQPRIFEIGRSAAHDLVQRPKDPCVQLGDCVTIHPPSLSFLRQVSQVSLPRLQWAVAGAVVLAVLLLCVSSSRFRSVIASSVSIVMHKPGDRLADRLAYVLVRLLIAAGVI